MNNRDNRIKYLEEKFDMDYVLCEELFIVNVVKNKYAYDFVEKELLKIEDIDKVLNFQLNKILKYDISVIFQSCIKNINAVSNVMAYMCYAEVTENFKMIERLIKKSNSLLYKMMLNDEYYNEFEVDEGNIMSFIYSFFEYDLDLEYDEELISALQKVNERAVYNFVITKPSPSDQYVKVLEVKFESLISKFNLKKDVNLKSIGLSLISEQMDIIKKRLEILGYSEDEIMCEQRNNFIGKKGWELKLLKDNTIKNKGYKQYKVLDNILIQQFLNFDKLKTVELNYKDVISILYLIDTLIDIKVIGEDDVEATFITIMFFYIIAIDNTDMHSALTKLAFDCEKEKVNKLKDKECIIEKNKSIIEENNVLNKKITEKDKEIEELKKRLNESNAKLNSLNNKLSKIEDNKDELVALRELFFTLEKAEIVDDNVNNKDVSISLDKVAFIGGNDNLQLKLKAEFNQFTFISADDKTKDLSFLKNMRYIFIHTHMPHALYYKIIDIIRTNNIKFSFLNASNIDILKKEIIEKLL